MRRLQDRVAVVTGGGSGIGHATCLRLAEEGAKVVVADIDGDSAQRVAAEITEQGGTAIAYQADVSHEDAVIAMVRLAVTELGGLDVLHSNAGGTSKDLVGRDLDLLSLPLDLWERTLAVNLTSAMLGAKHAIPHMLERGRGSIINTSSNSGAAGDTIRAAYGAAKAGVHNLTMTIATMYGKQGIRCNAVSPGFIMTPATPRHIPPDLLKVYEDAQLLDRLGAPADIAAAVAFLASDDSAFITGQVLHVDGGQMAHLSPALELRRLGH